MTTSTLAPAALRLAIGRRALHQLRASLERDLGIQAAVYLQEAGFAAGEEAHQALAAWVAATYRVDQPAELDARHLGEALSGFFREAGWGELTVEQLGDAIVALDSADWAEASEGAGAPTCHFSCGMLADLLGRIAGNPVAAMEVECRSRGDARCRFLTGAPESLTTLYERIAQGMGYREALGLPES